LQQLDQAFVVVASRSSRGSAAVAHDRPLLHISAMCSRFEDLRKSEGSADDDLDRQMTARREIDAWLSEGRRPPTDKQLEAIGREWPDDGLLGSDSTEIPAPPHA
jgi:hypothetical protein